MKKVINYLWFLACAIGYSQTVSVSDAEYAPSNLVDLLLDNACVQVSGVDVSSTESVAYFNNNSGNFPIDEGVIIRSGKAKFSEGAYTGNNMGSQVNSNTDADLQAINNVSGQSAAITDVAFLQFDFVPLSNTFDFNFLFASNEYGEWQCASSDVFAFLLTDLATGETQNLAVIPGTDTPVSVKNIKDNSYNSSCESSNSGFFASYQVNNPAASTINMKGYTNIMTASANIVPGNPYRIKLVIGDSNDADYDSAIFLSAGSFNADIDLGEDRMVCEGDSDTIFTGLDSNQYAHTWTFNGEEIPGETGNSLVVNQTGAYAVTVTQNGSNCMATDEIMVSALQVENPTNITACFSDSQNYIYDLSVNNPASLGLDPDTFGIIYFASQEDAQNQNPIPTGDLNTYSSAGNESIFFKIENNETGNTCNAVYSFDLLVNSPIVVNTNQVVELCASAGANTSVNLSQVISQISNQNNSTGTYQYRYFHTMQNAQDNENRITNPNNFSMSSVAGTTTFWLRVSSQAFPQCFEVVSFQVVLNTPPQVDELPSIVVECENYILPSITHGNYFTGAGGTGTALFPGDVIDTSGTYYIYNSSPSGCSNQSSFTVAIVGDFELDEIHCGSFKIPSNPYGTFYTAPGGEIGSGEVLSAGTTITESQTVYFYTEVEGNFCTDKPFDIEIMPLPEVDTPNPVVTCNSYTLPTLNNGNYYTQPNGNGTLLNAGHIISSSQNLYVYSNNGTCKNQHEFSVTITPNFEDINACGSYQLPNMAVGAYFTQAMGQGQQILPGTSISETQTVYYFAETSTTPNCTNNISFEVNVTPLPEVDVLEDVLLCEAETFVLPELNNGQYFTEANRNGTQLLPGDLIESTTTIYINNLEYGCTNESIFEVEIRELPPVENFTDIYSCGPYELPVLTHGTYYTQPGGNGQMLNGGDFINTSKTIYIYNEYQDLNYCNNENSFTVHVEDISMADFEDVSACNSFTLPALSRGNYYTESGGQGTRLIAGEIIFESQEVFVYYQVGTRFMCEAEKSFYISISETPILGDLENIIQCESYTLPELPQDEYNMSYHWASGGRSEITGTERTFSTPGTHTVYVYATAKENAECFAEAEMQITINPLQKLSIAGGILCKDSETGEVLSPVWLSSGLDPNEFDVEWYLNSTLIHIGADFEATEPGVYLVKTEKLDPNDGNNCNYAPTVVTVGESSQPVIRAKVTEAFAETAVINVEVVKGYSEYEYQLNGGGFQSSNEFYDVASGSHKIRVRGINGNCGDTVVNVEVLKYPKFFTPNGDGINDTWNIPDLADHPEAKIYMHDRYGKLLFILSATGSGWDGQFHGRQMPSNDYWFRATYTMDGVEKEFKANVTLKR